MSDSKGRRGPPPPSIEVVRRPAGPAPTPTPRQVVPSSARPAPSPRPGPPRPAGPSRPGGPGGGFRPSGPRRSGPPRPPPTPEQVQELARRERVPARIAKGDLEGKMKSRIWRKLHAEEAKRFDQAYTLMEKTPGLDLAEAFALIQSGMSLEELRSRRAKVQKKAAVKEARSAVSGEAIDQFLAKLAEEKAELAVVLGERTLLDKLEKVEPVAFRFEKSGRLEKLQVVLITRRASWDVLSPGLVRDPKLAQKPQSVPREPERRPFSDPRVFLEQVKATVQVILRNGITLQGELLAVGPFDLLIKTGEHEHFVPIHAVVQWSRPSASA